MNHKDLQQSAEAKGEKIELRSEKVRNIIGQPPPFLIRWGNAILAIILILAGLIAWLIIKVE
ncbi:MAG: hypothetical protein LBH04_05555 [Tannerellaceae bacterium]|jgi:hypothetical protein|nr:hypothetical protein [Tannerellaceae bacterium]